MTHGVPSKPSPPDSSRECIGGGARKHLTERWRIKGSQRHGSAGLNYVGVFQIAASEVEIYAVYRIQHTDVRTTYVHKHHSA